MLICEMLNGYASKIIDFEAAFLHGDLKEEIYNMDCPEGMTHMDDKCLVIKKTIYGLVQSDRMSGIDRIFLKSSRSVPFYQERQRLCGLFSNLR